MQEFVITPADHLRKAITREGHVVVIQKRSEYEDVTGYYPYKYVHPILGKEYSIDEAGASVGLSSPSIRDVIGWAEVLEQKPKATHTPGPWSVDVPCFDSPDLGYLWGIHGEDFIICDMCGDGYSKETQEVNARLIAAAPELFELAKRVMNLNPFGDTNNYNLKLVASALVAEVEGE